MNKKFLFCWFSVIGLFVNLSYASDQIKFTRPSVFPNRRCLEADDYLVHEANKVMLIESINYMDLKLSFKLRPVVCHSSGWVSDFDISQRTWEPKKIESYYSDHKLVVFDSDYKKLFEVSLKEPLSGSRIVTIPINLSPSVLTAHFYFLAKQRFKAENESNNTRWVVQGLYLALSEQSEISDLELQPQWP